MSKRTAVERQTDSIHVFDSLFASHHEAVLRYCVRRLGPFEAEDAAADVFAVAWRRLDDVPEGDTSRAWLIGVAYRVVGNRHRARRRQNGLQARLESEPHVSSRPDVAPDMDTQQLHLALSGLSPTDQELIRLSAWDGLTRNEIASVLGIRVNAVDQRLHRARARLKARWDRLSSKATVNRTEEAPT